MYTIIVNGQEHKVLVRRVSYDDILGFAFPLYRDHGLASRFTITYRCHDCTGPVGRPGTLTPGQTVKLWAGGMVFNVADTSSA